MPVLTIIAGPNGAGKSTHSKDLLLHIGIEAFDFDKEFYSIWAQFGFDPMIEQGAFDKAEKLYFERKHEALQNNKDFAFETNYHTRQVLSILDDFRARGYYLELIFICLDSSEIAIERVKDRVAKGGHSVDEATIRERFSKGLQLLDESFHSFDTISIYLSKYKKMEGLSILEPPTKKVISVSMIPSFLTSHLPRLMEFIAKHR